MNMQNYSETNKQTMFVTVYSRCGRATVVKQERSNGEQAGNE